MNRTWLEEYGVIIACLVIGWSIMLGSLIYKKKKKGKG